MNFEHKKKPSLGQIRIVTKFFWFPKKLRKSSTSMTLVTRWLERASIVQRFTEIYMVLDFSTNIPELVEVWQDLRWNGTFEACVGEDIYHITVKQKEFDSEELFEATVEELPDLAEYAETYTEACKLVIDSIDTYREIVNKNA